MDESGTDEAECRRKLASGKRVAGTIGSLVNARSLMIECARVLHELLLVLVHTYGSETMIWREKEGIRIRAVQTDNLIGLLCIRRMDKVPNARIRQLYGVTKGADEKIDEWFGHVERMENDRIVKRIYVGDCAGSYLVGRLRKRWIDTMKDYLKNRGLDVR